MSAFVDPWRAACRAGGEGHAPVVAVLLASSRRKMAGG
jgi:hypothetical protein